MPNFTGLSFREKGLTKLVEKHFNLAVKPIMVLDPTLLIDKNYYLNEIKGLLNKIEKIVPWNESVITAWLIFIPKIKLSI